MLRCCSCGKQPANGLGLLLLYVTLMFTPCHACVHDVLFRMSGSTMRTPAQGIMPLAVAEQ
jgi:hypothetical protein